MFERFTERARQVVVLANDESHRLGHREIGTEHLLLGLLREEDGIAAHVLRSFDVDRERVHAAVVEAVGRGQRERRPGQTPFTRSAKKMLERSLEEAIALDHTYIGTEHILLALTADVEGRGRRILGDLGVDSQRVRDEVIRTLSGPGRRRRAPERASERSPSSTGTIGFYDENVKRRELTFGAAILFAGVAVGLLVGWFVWG